MNKTIGVIITIAVIVILIIVGAVAGDDKSDNGSVAAAQIAEFTTQARGKVVAEIGQPIEGFEPSMFLQVYPGLEEQDFGGVQAMIGGYEYNNGALVYDLKGEPELHSAARAITDEGMGTLLSNVADRLDVDLEGDGTINEIFTIIETGTPSTSGGTVDTNTMATTTSAAEVAIVGTITCLPHRITTGPQTLECAIGLQSDSSQYYALRQINPTIPTTFYNTGTRVRATGRVLAPTANEKYNIKGTIELKTLTQVN